MGRKRVEDMERRIANVEWRMEDVQRHAAGAEAGVSLLEMALERAGREDLLGEVKVLLVGLARLRERLREGQ